MQVVGELDQGHDGLEEVTNGGVLVM